MNEINGLWIYEEAGELFYSQEFFMEGLDDQDTNLYHDLIASIERFVTQLGEKETERIELGNSKFFIVKSKEHKLIFIIKTTQNANNKKVSKLLNKIHKKFMEKFHKFLLIYSTKELRIYIDDIFKKEIENLVQGTQKTVKDKFTKFFDSN